ncbi:MAG: hypothetical protein JW770_05945 [Actinobacteria bacterium]|nr:hypothetical protein [Actinomycetota bacterium]
MIIICLLSCTFVCNFCAGEEQEKIGTGEESGTAGGEPVEDIGEEAGNTEQEDHKDGKEDGSLKEEPEEELEAPSIELEIFMGPVYQEGICFYRIVAVVTGNPKPGDVEWSRDDSNGAWGDFKAQVNLDDPDDTCTLTATVKNPEGTASDSIDLAWGCNKPPGISSISVDGDSHHTGQAYNVYVNASDADGDTLLVTWSITGGTINDTHSNPTTWTTPDSAGDYVITVKVEDGNGGMDTFFSTVTVVSALPYPEDGIDLPNIASEGGNIEEGIKVNNGGSIFAGDSGKNKVIRGFISYDITSLNGATITDATISFNLKSQFNNPSDFLPLWISSVYWGAEPLSISDFSLSGTSIQSFSSPSFTCSHQNLKQELQEAIDDGKFRFQVMVYFMPAVSNGDDLRDGWEYDQNGVVLNARYTSP